MSQFAEADGAAEILRRKPGFCEEHLRLAFRILQKAHLTNLAVEESSRRVNGPPRSVRRRRPSPRHAAAHRSTAADYGSRHEHRLLDHPVSGTLQQSKLNQLPPHGFSGRS